MARWRSRKKYGGSIPALWKKSVVHFHEKFEKSEDLFEKPFTNTRLEVPTRLDRCQEGGAGSCHCKWFDGWMYSCKCQVSAV